jgi:hypothetical protein
MRIGLNTDFELIGIPGSFVEHSSQEQLRKDCGIDYKNTVRHFCSKTALDFRVPDSIGEPENAWRGLNPAAYEKIRYNDR